MRVPRVLIGTVDMVARAAAPWSRVCLEEGHWPGDDGLGVDPAEDGLSVMLGPPARLLENDPGCHTYWPALDLTRAVVEEDVSPLAEQDAFERWLEEDWSLAGLLAPVNVAWFRQPTRFRPFLAAVVERWDALTSLGPLYSDGATAGPLWSLNTTLTYLLSNMGLPPERLRAPLPPGGLAALAHEVKDWDGSPVIERWD